MKKSLLIVIILLFLTSCTSNRKPDTIDDEIHKEPGTIRYTGDSIQLMYEDKDIIINLPKVLGIYKAEVEADFSQEKWAVDLISVELTC